MLDGSGCNPSNQQGAVKDLLDDEGLQRRASLKLQQILQDGVGRVQLQDLLGKIIFLAEILVDTLQFRVERPIRVNQAGHRLREPVAGPHIRDAFAEHLF